MVSNWVGRYVVDHTVQIVLAVLVIIIGTVLLGSLINGLLTFVLRSAGLSGTDRLLGMAFGFVRGVFIVSLLILVTKLTSFAPAASYTNQSVLYHQFTPIVDWLYGFTPGIIKQMAEIEQKQHMLSK
jgi:membrane protein required for colicin V production